MKKIITISRQFGSGGHTTGKLVSEKLNIPFYDEDIIEKVMTETGFSREFVSEAGEYASNTNSLLFNIALSATMSTNGTNTTYDKVYLTQNKIIRELAGKESCVIVGRCADYILKDKPDCLRIFIHSDEKSREKRILEQYGEISGKTIQERITEKDQRRKLYYKHYTGRDWGVMCNYHLSIDSNVVGIERSAEWIASLCKHQ